MRDRDDRIVAALRTEAESVPLTLTEAAVHERLARPPATPWARLLGVAVAGAAVGAVVLAIAIGPQPRSGADQAEPIQLEPGVALPSPYDWDGVRDALAPRGLQLEIPSAAARAEDRLTARQVLEIVGGEHAAEVGITIVSLHLATVTNENERLPLRRELMYVAESTGHDTGNCFTLVGAADGEPVIGACFYPERTQPYASLPVGIYLADRPIGTICLGLTLPRDEDGLLMPHAADLRAQWWTVGSSGDCTTTNSSVVSTSVELVVANVLAVAIPLTDGGERRIVVEIVQPLDGGFATVVTSADERAEVIFNLVELIDPSVPGQIPPPTPASEPGSTSAASPSPTSGTSVRDTIWRVVVSDLVVRSEPGVGDASTILAARLTDEDRVLVVDGPR